ncbi:uncharacterized protein LOC141657656 [Silene latifolia]|uniref:uncharacterized protein LOC141657656 n=1 Tax=Silene latifolia TaxID=37657 RepID=UPI003D782116
MEPKDMDQEHESIVDVSFDHSDSSSDGDFDVSAELLDLNEAPDVDYSSVESDDEVVKPSSRKIKKPPVKKSEICSKKEKKNKEGIDVEGDTNVPSVESFEGISGFEFVDPVAMKKLLKKKNNGDFREMFMRDIWEEEHRLWIDNYMWKELNLDQQNEMMDETHKDPSELLARLPRFQKEWLSWALKQEESPIKEGILVDEMGMGKTVQAIALVPAKRDIQRAISGVDRSLSPPSSCSSSVLPESEVYTCKLSTSALHQGQREIE